MSSTSVSSIGAGNMGAAIAQALLTAKTPVTVWNRTIDRPQVTSLVDSGAIAEPDIAKAVSRSDVLLLCVVDFSAMYELFEPLDSSVFQGKTVVNVINCTPREAREAEVWMKDRGVSRYFDGAIMIPPQLVGTSHSYFIMSGGNEQSYKDIGALLEPAGKSIFVGNNVDAASARDLAALSAMYGMFMGAFIGFGLLQKQGSREVTGDKERILIKPAVESVMVPTLTQLVPYVTMLAGQIDDGMEHDSAGNPLSMQLAGVKNIVQAGKEERVDVRALEVLADLMERAVNEGWGPGGVAAVGRYIAEKQK